MPGTDERDRLTRHAARPRAAREGGLSVEAAAHFLERERRARVGSWSRARHGAGDPRRALLAATGHNVSVPELEVRRADVTKLEVDAIANAANTDLQHGGGVAAAIARAGGPEVQRESDAVAPIGLGEAVETTAGDMPARYVIHAATMELGGPTSREIIERATESTVRRAEELGCRSLALVAFGTGVGGFPLEEAAEVMVGAVRRSAGDTLERVVFCVRGEDAEQAFEHAISTG